MKRIEVAVLVLEGAFPSAVFGFRDIFELCNSYCKRENEPAFNISYVGLHKSCHIGGGLVHPEDIRSPKRYEIVLIPPLIGVEEIEVNGALKSWLIRAYHQGSLLCAACMGSFILGDTGLLDGRRATTHWLLEDRFKARFPQVKLNTDMILVDEGSLLTAGGMTAYIDLSLYIIEKRLSAQSANYCASLLLVDRGRDSQQCYKNLSHLVLPEDSELKTLLAWMKKNMHKSLSVKLLAKKIGMQERSFIRRFKKEIKQTPNQYLQNLRIEEAKQLLVNTLESFEEITYAVGFVNESSFRRLFKRETALNPGEYRKKFKLNQSL